MTMPTSIPSVLKLNPENDTVREPIPTWYFVLVVVHHANRFLLVQEHKHEQRWYLPAGRVAPDESLIEAAQRNTIQESCIPIIPEGILRIEHTLVQKNMVRVRVIFVARPEDNTPPKSKADQYTLGAKWFSLEEIDKLPIRGKDVRDIFRYMARGATVYPLDLLTVEGAPYKLPRYRW